MTNDQNCQDIRASVEAACSRLAAEGLLIGTAGNVSVRAANDNQVLGLTGATTLEAGCLALMQRDL